MTNAAFLARWKRKKIAVLKGGWSRERSISLKTGAAVEAALRQLGFSPASIDVDHDLPKTLIRSKIDFCFIALHGTFGEDGGVQSLLDRLGIGYTGSGALASAVAMDKALAKRIFAKRRVPTPSWSLVSQKEYRFDREAVDRRMRRLLNRGPVFIKPVDQGSAIGVSRVDRSSQIAPALSLCFRHGGSALVERYIEGRELTVGILGQETLPVVEIIPKHRFYDFHSKYAAGGSVHVVPALMTAAASRRAQKIALDAFDALGCSVYGRVDLMMDSKGGVHVLEINTIPGMTPTSLLPDAAMAAGIGFEELVLDIMKRSIHRDGSI